SIPPASSAITTPAPVAQRMTLSRSPEKSPSACNLFSLAVLVVARVVGLHLDDFVSVLADLVRELELGVIGALVGVAALAILFFRVAGAQFHQVRPLILFVVLLVGRVLLAGSVAGLAADSFHQRGAQLLLLSPVLADFG